MTKALADGLIKRTSYMYDEIALKTVHKDKKLVDWEKRSKTLNEAKSVKNTCKNPHRVC